MLSDRDRTLLAPHLVLLRAARRELAGARRDFEEAERALSDSTGGTDWRDRVLGGLFSADDGRTQRYRRARDARKAAEKVLADAEAKYAKYAERVDGLLEPMLARDDPGFRARLEAVRACDKALRGCEQTRRDIATMVKAQTVKGSESWHEAEFARRRRDELITELHARGPALTRTIERAARSVGEERIELNLGGLPATGMAVDQRLGELELRLDAAIKEISRWRVSADQGRAAALRAAHDSL
ncbi:hypothetical protein [Paractinoplanes maris]|uniref:hypothetical protein n=1 Tax=Paractinoplanes maris TaxID=1734446 RepID=UPI002021DB99|nr:hypothetical protein [Actinoplanes maris]